VVARDVEIDEKGKLLRLLDPSILNGSQTQGVIRDFLADQADDPGHAVHIKFEIIVTQDDALRLPLQNVLLNRV